MDKLRARRGGTRRGDYALISMKGVLVVILLVLFGMAIPMCIGYYGALFFMNIGVPFGIALLPVLAVLSAFLGVCIVNKVEEYN